MVSPETRNRVLIGAGLIGAAAMLAWSLSTPAKRDTPRFSGPTMVAEGAAEPAQALEPASATAPSPNAQKLSAPPPAPPPAVDLFEGEVPDFMAKAHAATLEKTWLDVSVQKELYNWGQTHRDDARPQLLLAWDSMNRDWKGIAVRMYRIAFRADKRAKYDPTMLRDLVDVASQFDTVEYHEASEIIREAYGAEAVPHIDEKMAELSAAGDSAGAARLRRLRVDVSAKR